MPATVTIETPVRIERDGEHYTEYDTVQREYTFVLENYRQVKRAAMASVVGILTDHLDGKQTAAYDEFDGWAVDLPDGGTVAEEFDADVSIDMHAPQLYHMAIESVTDADDAGYKVYRRLYDLATAKRPVAAAATALMPFMLHNTVGEDYHDAILEFSVPETYMDITDT